MTVSIDGFDLVELVEVPDVAGVLARWHVAEWAHLYDGWDEPTARAEFEAMTRPGEVPTTWVAFEPGRRDRGAILGSISLIADDELPGFESVGPWLASLYVVPEARGRGVGRRLSEHLVAEARAMGFERLYLFTDGQAAYYAQQGWRRAGAADARGHPATVMTYELSELAPRRATISRWISDPWVGGAYSYLRVGGSSADRARLGSALLPGLYLAGEATSVEYPGTAHGAWFSGERAADLLDTEVGAGQVAVVGAGLAGLAAARRLTAAGRTVIVFEAATEVGGRTRVDRSLGGALPLGATWAHGNVGNPFHDLAMAAGATGIVGNVFEIAPTYLAGTGRIGPTALAELRDRFDRHEHELDRTAAEAETDRPVGPVLRAALDTVTDEGARAVLGTWWRGEFENLYAAPVDDLSLRTRAEPFHLLGPDVMLVGDLGAAVRPLTDGLDVRLGVPVTGLERAAGGWIVRSGRSEEEVAAVVVTAALPVLQQRRIAIDPPLPPDVDHALDHIGVGPVAKAFFTFDSAWWAPDPAFWCVAPEPLPFELWVDVSGFAGRPTLCAFSVGEAARTAEGMSEDELCRTAYAVLRSTIGPAGS